MATKNSFYTEYKQRLISLTENDVAVFNHVEDLPSERIQCDVYISILCLKGKASCLIGNRMIEMSHGDIFFGHPNQFIENAMTSFDFEFVGALLSPASFENLLILGGISNARFIINDNPVIHLEEEVMEILISDFNYLKEKLSRQSLPHFKEYIKYIVQAMVYELYDCIEPKLKMLPHSYTSPELIFQKFMSMVRNETPAKREVQYYADKLCITPKYLSLICKQTSGNTASEIINNIVSEHIGQLLRNTDKSIKEISIETGFDSLSFFGKYVKRKLGMSPREYRQQVK